MKLNVPAKPPRKPPTTTVPEQPRRIPDQLLSLKQAAAYTGVSDVTVRRWIKVGLPHLRAGRQIRIDKAELIEFISQE